MIGAGEDELFCDFVETYGILDPRALGAKRMAVLAYGLRNDSRIKQKIAGTRIGTDTQLLASAVDFLALLAWRICCKSGTERPASVLAQLEGNGSGSADGAAASRVLGFDTAEDFEAARSRILKQTEERQGEEAKHGD